MRDLINRKSFSTLAAVLALALGHLLLNVRPAAALLLVHEGKPCATIVVPKNASPQIRRAAEVLQEYIQKSSDARLPIALIAKGNSITVGLSPTARQGNRDISKLDQDGFVLRGIGKRNYLIVGGSDWGTEFGVIDFLERYIGVRWLIPSEIGIDVPRHRTIDIPATKVVQNPVFVSRQLSPIIQITAKDEASRWGRFNRAKSRIEFHHNLLRLFPASKFAKSNPEFYPILNGQRYIPRDQQDESWQPNLSAPGIVDAAVAQIEDYFRKNPQETSYSLGMNDSNAWDQSAASLTRRSGKKNYLGLEDVSDDYFTWANAVVEKVLQKYPDKWFGTLAYHCIAEPPTRVKVHPRIVPFLTYDRMRWEDPELRAWGQKLTERWARVSPILGWYDYAYGITYQLPRVYFHRMQQYLSWGAAHHVKYSYAELYPNWGEGPKSWVFTRLLWNPNQNVDALLDDWYSHYAGPKAAPEIRKYYAIWERFWTVDIYKSTWNRKTGEYLLFGDDPSYLLDVPQSYISRSDASLQAALKLADTPQRKARVAKLMQMWEFYKSSILTYQGMNWVTKNTPKTEAEAIAALNRTEQVMSQSRKRQDLLASFYKDPLFALTAKYVHEYPGTSGKNWGSSLLWRLYPWAAKSSRIKERLAQMAASTDAGINTPAAFMLKFVEGTPILVSANNSFEEGAKGWEIWDKAEEGAEYHRGIWGASSFIAATGAESFLVEGVQRGGLLQSLPYNPGNYYATASYYVPENSKIGTAKLILQVLGAQGEVLADEFVLPTTTVPLQPGQWAVNAVPFSLPANRSGAAASVRLLLMLTDFEPEGKIYLDDIGVFKVDE